MAVSATAVSERPFVMEEREAFVEALGRLDDTLDENTARAACMKQRIAMLQEACETGQPLHEFAATERAPLLVHLLTQSAEALDRVGSHVRRTEARVLHREGMTMEQIARLVRRQPSARFCATSRIRRRIPRSQRSFCVAFTAM